MQMQTNEDVRLFRACLVEKDEEKKLVRVSVSSEAPCRNVIWHNGAPRMGQVVLSHEDGAVDMSYVRDGIVLRDQHGGDVVGRAMGVALSGGKLVANGGIVWGASERAKVIKADVESGVLREMSIEADYDRDAVQLVEDDGKNPIFKVVRWKPLAAAFVPVPADTSVGIGREFISSAEEAAATVAVEDAAITDAGIPAVERSNMDITDNTAGNPGATSELDSLKRDLDTSRGEITALKDMILKAKEAPALERKEVAMLGLSQKDIDGYSISRAILSLADGKNCPEIEVSDQVKRSLGVKTANFVVPMDVMLNRAVTTGEGSGAGLVPTQHEGTVIDLLRSKLVLSKLGVTYMGGLRGDVEIPRQSGAATGYFVGEDAEVTSSNSTFDNIKLSIHTAAGRTSYTRNLLLNSVPSVDQLIWNDLTAVVARKMEEGVVKGNGASGAPTGFMSLIGDAQTIATPGSPTWAEICSFQGALDAYFDGGAKWLINNATFAAMRAQARFTNTGIAVASMEGGNKFVADDPAITTTIVPAGTGVLGFWENIVVGMWGGLEIDSEKIIKTGSVDVVAMQSFDVGVRHAEAFAWSNQLNGYSA